MIISGFPLSLYFTSYEVDLFLINIVDVSSLERRILCSSVEILLALPYPSISGKSVESIGLGPLPVLHRGLFARARSKSPRDPFAESRMPLTTKGVGIERNRGASSGPKIPALSRHRVLRSPIRIISGGRSRSLRETR